MHTPETTGTERYIEPGWFTRKVFNPAVVHLTRWGISVRGSRELRVKGRTSGEWRTVPVNLLRHDDRQLPGRAAREHAVGPQPPRRADGRAPGRAPHRGVPRDRAGRRRQGHDPARVPPALEDGSRGVLRRRRARLDRRGAARHRRPAPGLRRRHCRRRRRLSSATPLPPAPGQIPATYSEPRRVPPDGGGAQCVEFSGSRPISRAESG